jgi:transcriptional antiterminator Rof (Rho-off)
MKQDYTPIACNLVDYIEESITLHKEGEIVYVDEQGKYRYYLGKARTWETRADKAEYLILPDDTAIRFDRLITFMGKKISGASC